MLSQEQIGSILQRLTPDEARLWSSVNWQLGEDFTSGEWEHALRSFLTRTRPDLLPRSAAEVLPTGAVYITNCVQETVSAQTHLNAIERSLGYQAAFDATTAQRLSLLRSVLATSVVMSRGAFALTLGITFGLGLLAGLALARRSARSSQTLPARR